MGSQPSIALLSNGSYSVMITAACAGYSTWRHLDVTRWREDATRDCWGQFYYVRDLSDESVWSIGTQPLPRPLINARSSFTPIARSFVEGMAMSRRGALFVWCRMQMPRYAR